MANNMTRYGLEPDEFEELAIRRFYKIIFECHESADDFIIKPPSSGNIRKRIQKCVKKYMPRQNITNPDKIDKRRSTGNIFLNLIQGRGDDKNIPSPHKLQKDTCGKRGVTKATKQYHNLYHEAQNDLFIRENILTDDYEINKGGRLERNGMEMSPQDFLDFIKENLTVGRLRELERLRELLVIGPTHTSSEDPEKQRLRELLVIGHTRTSSKDPEKQRFIDILVVAFRILYFRYCNEMAIANDLEEEGEKQNWKNHVDVIIEVAVYIAVLDEIYHVKWGKCGIEDIAEKEFPCPTDFPLKHKL